MMTDCSATIRFPMGMFPDLRTHLLSDKQSEAFALLLGKYTKGEGHSVIKVTKVIFPNSDDYDSRSLASLRVKREFIYQQLVQMQEGGELDALIDVHTHPFCRSDVAFSSADDRDEMDFKRWLTQTLDNVHYASIVLSQSDYSARVWEMDQEVPVSRNARIKTQTVDETWPCADRRQDDLDGAKAIELQEGFLARSALALGLESLRQMMTDQAIAIVGVGGLGSVIAENLIHSGFQTIHLIDPDRVEITNLNRIVGAYYNDAIEGRYKADVVKQHLQRINPRASVEAHTIGVEDKAALQVVMECDWLIVATDNHFSRYESQNIALQLGIPLISAGVNITVKDQQIADMSGEVIIARYGDGLCLNCLGRINPTSVAAERNRGLFIGDELIRRGYVTGHEVKEPAVKTLNAIVGAMAVDVLVNQYAQRQAHVPIRVFENNVQPAMYPDLESVTRRPTDCFSCS